MRTNDIINMLNQLGELRAKATEIETKKQEIIDRALLVVKPTLEKLDEKKCAFEKRIETYTEAIKIDVKKHGESVKGNTLHAVFNKGRITWQDDKLQGYAVDHPDILTFRKEGEPSVAIREIKEK